jgi:hypothetical protein
MSNWGAGLFRQSFNEGAESKLLENIKKLMENLHFTFDQAADALGLSESDKEKYSAKI